MQIYEYSLVEVVILVSNLLDHFQLVCLDILLQHFPTIPKVYPDIAYALAG